MKNTKQKLSILTITLLLIIVPIVMAGIPSVNQVTTFSGFPARFLRMDGAGNALYGNTNNQYYKFNQTDWYEVFPPTPFSTSNVIAEKGYVNFYILYHNNTHYQIWQYSAQSSFYGNWTLLDERDTTTSHNKVIDFACNPYLSYSSCRILLRNATGSIGTIINADTGSTLYATPTSSTAGKLFLHKSNQLWLFDDAILYRRNTLDTTWETILGSTDVKNVWDEDNLYFGFTRETLDRFYRYNQTLASVYFISTGGYTGRTNLFVNTESQEFVLLDKMDLTANGFAGYLSSYFDNGITYFNTSISAGCDRASSRKYDYQVGYDGFNGFTSCEGTAKVVQIGSNAIQEGTTTLSTDIQPNPAVYGQDFIVSATPTHTAGGTSQVHVEIYDTNSTSDFITEWDWINVPSATTATNSIGGTMWTEFQIGHNYTITFNATFSISGTEYKTQNFSVIGSTNVNVTNYTIISYGSEGFTNIVAVTKLGENNVYSVGKNQTSTLVTSYDFTNPASPIRKHIHLAGTGVTPTTISIGNNTRLYVGTDDGLYLFNNSESGDAESLINYSTPFDYPIFQKNYVYDLNAINDELAWTCQDGYTSDAVRRFNHTQADYDTTISESPCYTSQPNGQLLLVHKGTSGIKIYNSTNQALISTITGIVSQPSGATHDRISSTQNFMFAVTGQTQISKYNITNPASPVKMADCYTNNEAQAIEAIDANKVITASINGIRICDFNNSATYEPISGKYQSTPLKSYTQAENPTEIILLTSDGKIAIAEGHKIGVYYITTDTLQVTTNQAPIISSINTNKNTFCLNEQLTGTIIATDVDNPEDLSYDYDCEGTKPLQTNHYTTNSFSCYYSTSGTKTLKAWASDGFVNTLLTKSILVNNCVPSAKIEIKVLDGTTGNIISGATATLTGTNGSTKTTDVAGVVLWENLVSNETYTISISKSNYAPYTKSVFTMPIQQVAYLTSLINPTTGEPTTILSVYVYFNQTGTPPVENQIVSVNEPSTGKSKYAFTDTNGLALISDMFPTTKSILVVGDYSQYITIGSGEQKTINVYIRNGTAQPSLTTRGCEDFVSGILLCSPLNTTGDGDNCQNDNHCLTGRCEPSVGGVNRKCSNFNWTQCDANGRARGNKCVASLLANKGMDNTTNAMLDNFLWVIILVFFFIGLIMFLNAIKK